MALQRAVLRLKAFYKREARHRREYQDGFFIGLVFGRSWILLTW